MRWPRWRSLHSPSTNRCPTQSTERHTEHMRLHQSWIFKSYALQLPIALAIVMVSMPFCMIHMLHVLLCIYTCRCSCSAWMHAPRPHSKAEDPHAALRVEKSRHRDARTVTCDATRNVLAPHTHSILPSRHPITRNTHVRRYLHTKVCAHYHYRYKHLLNIH